MNRLKGWKIGDRVVTVEMVPTIKGFLEKGATGTVVNLDWQLCVQWDNFDGGHNNSKRSDIAFKGDSLWWVFEENVQLDVGVVANE